MISHIPIQYKSFFNRSIWRIDRSLTDTLVKDHHLMLVWKNSQSVNNNNNNNKKKKKKKKLTKKVLYAIVGEQIHDKKF